MTIKQLCIWESSSIRDWSSKWAESGSLKSHKGTRCWANKMIFVIVVLVEGRAAWGDHMLQPPLPAGFFPLAYSPLLLHDTSSAPSVRTSVRGRQLVWCKFSCENDCLHELLFLTNYWHPLWSHWASHTVTAGTVQWNAGFMSHEQTPRLIMHHLFWLCTCCVVNNAVVLGA